MLIIGIELVRIGSCGSHRWQHFGGVNEHDGKRCGDAHFAHQEQEDHQPGVFWWFGVKE